MRCLCCLVPWLYAWPPWWLYWCLCVGGWWWLHLGWLLLWWTPCCLSFAVQDCWIELRLGRGPTSCLQFRGPPSCPCSPSHPPACSRRTTATSNVFFTTKHCAHLGRITMPKGTFISPRDQHHALQMPRLQEHPLHILQEHLLEP